jgi:hypothetical protein
LSTAQLDRPTPGSSRVTPVSSRIGPVLSRVTQLRHTSPGRLQLLLATLLAVGVLTALVAGLTAYSARSGTGDLGTRSQPLLTEAETIYSALADADTTAAQAFLTGGLEPSALTDRYDADLARATEALTSAARRTPDTGAAADAVQALSSGVPRYAALVATARADNRQGLPVGAAYLSAASTLNRDTLLPEADALFQAAQRDVNGGYGNARSVVWVTLFALLLIALFTVLIYAQRYLSRTTRRTFNVPLVAATVVTAVLALGAGGLLIAQETHLHRADTDGSQPVAQLAYARIMALRERGDEALTLVARGGSGPLETDFTDTAKPALDRQLVAVGKVLDTGTQRSLTGKHDAYLAAHAAIRKLDDGGDYDGAVALAIGPQTSKTFTDLTDSIGTVLEAHKSTFTTQIDTAGRGLGLLTVAGPLLALIVCGLAVAGIRARLEEYR